MSQGLTKTKRRIQSVSSTKKITKAMELVATVKLKRWKDNMENVLTYLKSMEEVISLCASGVNNNDTQEEINEFKVFKKAKGKLYIIVTSTLGLCGGYNYNLFKFINNKLNKEDKVLMIGTKGFTKLSHEDLDIDDKYVSFLDQFNYQSVTLLNKEILNLYLTGKYEKVVLVSTKYKNSLTFIPIETDILPLSGKGSKNNSSEQVVFEPNKEEVLSLIIPQYLNTLLYGKLTEALVCEQASRRNAMDSATDNAEELLDKLKIEFNKARQQAITQEITEVVGGSINK